MRALQPVAEEGVKRGQVEEVVFAVALHRGCAGKGGVGVDEVGWGVGGAADFAVVAVLVFAVAFRAFALDEAVGQEKLFFRVKKLRDGAVQDMAARFQCAVDGGG